MKARATPLHKASHCTLSPVPHPAPSVADLRNQEFQKNSLRSSRPQSTIDRMWTYVQKNGRLLDAKRRLISIGYSGHAEGKNNPALQDHANLGPIPCGTYTVTAPFD